MTKEEAKITLANLRRYMSGGGVVDKSVNRAIDMAIEALGKSESHWIPVTERLPEYGKGVLTITQEDDVYEVNHIIDEEHGEWFWEDNGKVIAWCELPEPYKEVTE